MEITFYALYSDTRPISTAVQAALKSYQERYGTPPCIVQTSVLDEALPDGLSLVVERVRLPKGHILVGELHGES